MDDAWMEQAACIDTDPAIFFPEARTAGADAARARARTICRGCPVRVECLDAAMLEEAGQQGWRSGIRGGLTPSERDKRARGVRWCPVCGTRFASSRHGRPHCSEECRLVARADTIERSRERVA